VANLVLETSREPRNLVECPVELEEEEAWLIALRGDTPRVIFTERLRAVVVAFLFEPEVLHL